MSACRRPCPSCPWRVDQDASAIPEFSLAMAEGLARTCVPGSDLTTPRFACHQSRDGEEFDCAGWLAVYGHRHVGVRFAVMTGRLPMEALEPDADWPELHASFSEVIEKLRVTA